MNKLILMLFIASSVFAQTSRFTKTLWGTDGRLLKNATVYISPQNGDYSTDALALTESITTEGIYERADVIAGLYKIYVDSSGGAIDTATNLYQQNMFHGSYTADNVTIKVNTNAGTLGVKDSSLAIANFTQATINYIGSSGEVTNLVDDNSLKNSNDTTIQIDEKFYNAKFVNYYTNLNTAITSASTDNKDVYISSNEAITSDETIPSNVRLKIAKGSKISISDTLTINGEIDAGLWQIFDLSGVGFVDLSNAKVTQVYPEWWGAVGNGTDDDAPAINQMIEAIGISATMVLSGKTYAVESDIELKNGNNFIGISSISSSLGGTKIKWTGAGNPTNGVITANINGDDGRMQSFYIKNIYVDVNGADNGVVLAGMNESCVIDNVQIFDFTGVGLTIKADTSGTYISQYTNFRNLRVFPSDSGADIAMLLEDTRSCTFLNITIDANAGAVGTTVGLKLSKSASMNVFNNVHIEDMLTPIRIGDDGNCFGNTFIGCDFSNPSISPASITFNGNTGTHGITVADSSSSYVFLNIRDNTGFDYFLDDEGINKTIISGATFQQIIGSDGTWIVNNDYEIDNIEAQTYNGIETTITSDNDSISVAHATVIKCNSTSGDISLQGLVWGVAGQYVFVYKNVSANKLTIVNNYGSAGQPILTAVGEDIVLAERGGILLVCDGTNWHEVGNHAQLFRVASSSSDALEVSATTSVGISTSGGNVTIGGLSNGVQGQVVNIFKRTSSNSLIIEHNKGSGTQKIITADGLDITLTSYGGVTLVFDGTSWYEISK